MEPNAFDRLNSRIWFMLVIVGMVLSLVGWYRYLSNPNW